MSAPPGAGPPGTARHILVPIHDFELGGSERIALRLASRWAVLGRRVTLVCGSGEGPLGALVGEGVELAACDPPVPRGPGSRRRLARTVAAIAAERRPDVVFLPGNFHWPLAPALARLPQALRPRLVAQVSNPLVRADRGGLRRRVFEAGVRRRLRGADAVVALAPGAAADAQRILRRPLAHVLPLPALEDDAPPPKPIPPGPPLVLAAGRLVAQKGFDLAIRAFARAAAPDARLVIVGEGPLRAELAALARRLGVAERVDLPGYAPDLRPWLDRARVFLLGSRFEGYGAVVVEALAAGRPVVAFDATPAVDELLARAPERGVGVPAGDVDALARALDQALARPPPDPAALAASVARFRIGPVAQAYLALFDAVVEGR